MGHDVSKAKVRNALQPRREAYWLGSSIGDRLALGFRRLDDGGTWIVRRPKDEGLPRYQSLGHVVDVSFDDAIKAAKAWAKAVRHGVVTSDVVTVADACRAYVRDRLREKGDANAQDADGRFRRTVYGHSIGKVKLAKLRTDRIKDWRANLDMAATSSNRNLAILKAALNAAVASRSVDPSCSIEWRSVKMLKVHTRRDLLLDRDQRRELIAALPEYARPLVKALCLLPVRPGALAQCVVRDFDAKRATLTIRHDKAGAGRTIPLSQAAVGLLREQVRGKLPGAPLIAYFDGSHWQKNAWVQLIHRTAEAAGLPKGTCLYSLRHATITDLLTAGVDAATVAKISGTSIQMLSRTYSHLLMSHAAQALDTLAL